MGQYDVGMGAVAGPGFGGNAPGGGAGMFNLSQAMGSRGGGAGQRWLDDQGNLLRIPRTSEEALAAQMEAMNLAQSFARQNATQLRGYLEPMAEQYRQGLAGLMGPEGGVSQSVVTGMQNRQAETLARGEEAQRVALGNRAAAFGGTPGAGGYAQALQALGSDYAGKLAGSQRDIGTWAETQRGQNRMAGLSGLGGAQRDLTGFLMNQQFQSPDLSSLIEMAGMQDAPQGGIPQQRRAPAGQRAGLAGLGLGQTQDPYQRAQQAKQRAFSRVSPGW